MSLDYQQASQKLSLVGQHHLLNYWERLNPDQQQQLLTQIEKIDINTFKQQQLQLKSAAHNNFQEILPFDDYTRSGNSADFSRGKELISQGLMGCLIVAGGQASRLRFEGPKGMYPVSPVMHKSLFQLLAEKVAAAGRQAGRDLPIAIMTSPLNHAATVDFFKQNNLFGLNSHQLHFFSQDMLPLLNQEGNLFLEAVDTIAAGPDGNGSALQHFYQSGIWSEWHRQGVRYLNFSIIDNPLADPFDAELLGFHVRNQNEISVKGTTRQRANEKVGLLAKKDGKTIVVEYTEMPEALRNATLPDGSFAFSCANLSLFCFSMDFVKKASLIPMPLHLAFKAVKYLDHNGLQHQPDKPMALKFEKFIFDILPRSQHVKAILYPRETCFAPLKNEQGEDSINTVRHALQKNDQKTFSQITGLPCTTVPFEIAQDFFYPTPSLIAKWRGQHSPRPGYIEP